MATMVVANAVTPPRRQQQQYYMSKLKSTNHLSSHASATSSPSTDVVTTSSTSPPSPSEASTAPTSRSPSVDGSPSTSQSVSKFHSNTNPGHHRIPAPPIPLLQPSRPAPVPSRAPSQISSSTQQDASKDIYSTPKHGHNAVKQDAANNKVLWSDRSRSRSLFGFRSGRRHSSRSSWGTSLGPKASRGDLQPSSKRLSASKSLGEVESKKASQRKRQDDLQDAMGDEMPEPPTKSDLRASPEAKPKSGHRKRWSLSTGYNAIASQNASSPGSKSTNSPPRHDRRATSPVNRSPSFFSSPRNAPPTAVATAGTITPSTSTSSRGHASVFSRSHTRSSSANTAATTPSTISTNMNSSTAAAAAAAAVMTSPTDYTVEPDANPTLQTLQPEPLNIAGRTTIVPDVDPITPGRTLMPSVPYSATGINAASSSTTSLTSTGGRRLRSRGFSLTGGTSSPSASVGRLGSLTGGWTSGWTSGNGWNPGGWSNGLRATRQVPGSPVGGSCTVNPGIVTGAVSSSVVNGYGEYSPSPSGRGKGRMKDVGNGCELDRRRERSAGRRGRSNSATPRPSPDSTTSLQSSPRKPSPPSESSKPSPISSPTSNIEAFPQLSATPSTTTLTSPPSPNVGSNLNKPWPPLPLHLRRRRASTPASPSRPRPLVPGDAVPFAEPPQPTGAGTVTTGTTPSTSSATTPTPQTPLPQTPMSATSMSTTGTASTIRANARDSQSSTALLLPKESAPQPVTPTSTKPHPPPPAPPKAATVPPTGSTQPPRRTSFSSLAAREARASFQMNKRGGNGGPASNNAGSSSGSGFSWRRPSMDNAARHNTTSSSPATAGSRSVSRGRGRRSISETRGRGPSSGRASDESYRGVGGVRREGSTRTVQAAVMPALLLLGTELFTPGKRPEDVGFGKAVAAGGAVRGVGGAGRAVGVLDVDDVDDEETRGSAAGGCGGVASTRPRAATTTTMEKMTPTRQQHHHHHQHTSSAFSYTHTPSHSLSRIQYAPSPSTTSTSTLSIPSTSTTHHALKQPLFPNPPPKTQPSFSLLPPIPQSQSHSPIPASPNPSSHKLSQTYPPPNTTTQHSSLHTAFPAPQSAPAPFISRLDPGSSCPFTVDATNGHFDPPGTKCEASSPFRRSLSPPVKDLGREGDLMAGMEAVWRKWEMSVA
ncbi:hypothetical protein IWZ03DRAFT_174743 [Phyllosticta citriasiana]|uniref:Uncharacterized protein n=1 Tax=Phyllosticta citriasiana TaxID=595635 RepID=A0ABR1KNQ9_9PEZI